MDSAVNASAESNAADDRMDDAKTDACDETVNDQLVTAHAEDVENERALSSIESDASLENEIDRDGDKKETRDEAEEKSESDEEKIVEIATDVVCDEPDKELSQNKNYTVSESPQIEIDDESPPLSPYKSPAATEEPQIRTVEAAQVEVTGQDSTSERVEETAKVKAEDTPDTPKPKSRKTKKSRKEEVEEQPKGICAFTMIYIKTRDHAFYNVLKSLDCKALCSGRRFQLHYLVVTYVICFSNAYLVVCLSEIRDVNLQLNEPIIARSSIYIVVLYLFY